MYQRRLAGYVAVERFIHLVTMLSMLSIQSFRCMKWELHATAVLAEAGQFGSDCGLGPTG